MNVLVPEKDTEVHVEDGQLPGKGFPASFQEMVGNFPLLKVQHLEKAGGNT
jgi:hypothetical protein